MGHRDPTQSITLRNRWGADFKRRWRLVIDRVKADVNANLEALIDEFVIDDGGLWMLPYIRETVAKSERLSSGDLGTDVRFTAVEREEVVNNIFALALRDVGNIKREVLAQGDAKAAAAAMDVPPQETDIAGLAGIVGAIITMPGDKTAVRISAMLDRINKIGITRSLSTVAVRVVGGISMGISKMAQVLGLGTVGVEAEFTTAGDNRVCVLCKGLETDDTFGLGAGIFPVNETFGIIPVHVRCRCRWVINVGDRISVQIPSFMR